MLFGITVILCCQLIGEAASRWLALPIPGPVIGMVLLLVFLWGKERFGPVSQDPACYSTETTGKFILANMSVLFVPASVGIIQKLDLLQKYGWVLAASILTSTILALIASAYTFVLVARLTGSREVDDE